MRLDADYLYNLLPAIYRIRDAEQGAPLKALIAILVEQGAVLQEDLDQLYDDQFIETCADWVVPYIGDLIGDRTLNGVIPQISSPRAEVANTIGFRRRKGTATVLEELARTVTGWPTRVVEYFQHLATTQYLNHLRLENLATPDLRDWEPLEQLNTPFDQVIHRVDVRRIASQRGRYNIPNIGIFLWRLQSYTVTHGTARAIADPSDGRYTFNPLGLDAPLFNTPQPESEITQLATRINIPDVLNRRELYEELEVRRQGLVDGQPPRSVYFSDAPGYQVFEIFLNGQMTPIPPAEIVICDLSDWSAPPPSRTYQPWERLPPAQDYRRKPLIEDPALPQQSLPLQVAVDPVLGRLRFPTGAVPDTVEVNYTYGFSGDRDRDFGGGPYARGDSVFPVLNNRSVTWQIGVTQTAPEDQPELVNTLTDAIDRWNNQPAGTVGVIAIMDSRTYAEDLPVIQLPDNSQLLIVAAIWPQVPVPDLPGQQQRVLGQLTPEGVRPHVQGALVVQGTAGPGSDNPGTLILNGLLIEGDLTLQEGNLGNLQITHCTLAPVQGGAIVNTQTAPLHVQLEHSICGPITQPEPESSLQVVNSIVDGGAETAIDAPGSDTEIETTTVFGTIQVRQLSANNSIFTGLVTTILRQQGCVRFSFLPLASIVPQRYRCQPSLALSQRAQDLGLNAVEVLPAAEQALIQARLTPQFTSRQYGDPGYAQLSQRSALAIRQGADDESEMGVFHDLFQPQRETNLRVRLDEYLRFGLEVGIFFAT